MASHPHNALGRLQLSPPGSPSTPMMGSRRPSVAQHAASVPAHLLPCYADDLASPPGAPTTPTYRRPPPVAHPASTMPANMLPSSFGSPLPDLPPSYQYNPMSPSFADSPRPHQAYDMPTPKQLSFSRPDPVNQRMHDQAARRHGIPNNYQTSKFYFSSFEYVRNSYFPVHPAFSQWVHSAGNDVLALIWREVDGNILLPTVVIYEYKSKANIEAYPTGARLEYLHLSRDGRSFTKQYMGDICVREEWHLLLKNKPHLMFAQPGNPKLLPIRGNLFKPKGGEEI